MRFMICLVVWIAALPLFGQLQMWQAGDYWAWREVPQAIQPANADTVPHAVRVARDRLFDRIYGPPPKGWVTSGPDRGQGEETADGIPIYRNLTAAVVQFADYRTIRSASRRSIYTEVKMNVEQVLRDPSGTVQPGKDLTVILAGGALRLSSGQIVKEYLDEDAQSGLQPGHRYLSFLNYAKDGGDYFGCEKSWLLSGGTAVPTSGPAPVAGMPEGEFIAAVRDVLSSGVK
jgi:hypothetical protein